MTSTIYSFDTRGALMHKCHKTCSNYWTHSSEAFVWLNTLVIWFLNMKVIFRCSQVWEIQIGQGCTKQWGKCHQERLCLWKKAAHFWHLTETFFKLNLFSLVSESFTVIGFLLCFTQDITNKYEKCFKLWKWRGETLRVELKEKPSALMTLHVAACVDIWFCAFFVCLCNRKQIVSDVPQKFSWREF